MSRLELVLDPKLCRVGAGLGVSDKGNRLRYLRKHLLSTQYTAYMPWGCFITPSSTPVQISVRFFHPLHHDQRRRCDSTHVHARAE